MNSVSALNIGYIGKVKFKPHSIKHMNSITLKQNGFAEFVPLKGLPFSSLPYNQGSVIVLTDSTITGKPASDILYIGKSKKLIKRIFGGYLAGYGSKANRKINSLLFDDGFLDKVSISWMLTDDPKAKQQELLEAFKKDHGEYPLWNAPKKVPQKPQIKLKPAPKTDKSRSAPRKPSNSPL
jgi:hypothetical protein